MTGSNTTATQTADMRNKRWLPPLLLLSTLVLVAGIGVITYQTLHVEWYTPYTPKPFEYQPDETRRMRLAIRLAFLNECPELETACEKSFRQESSAPLLSFAATTQTPEEKAYAYGMICSFQRKEDLDLLMEKVESSPSESVFIYPAMLLAPNNRTVEWYLRSLDSNSPDVTALSQACLLAFAVDQNIQTQKEWLGWWEAQRGRFKLAGAPQFNRAAACYDYYRLTQKPSETAAAYWGMLASVQWFLEGRHLGELDRMFEEGNRLFWTGKVHDARIWYDNCAKKNPNSMRAHAMLAHCAALRDDTEQLIHHAKSLQSIDPGSAYGRWLERFARSNSSLSEIPFFSLEESILVETDPNLTVALQLGAHRRGEYELVTLAGASIELGQPMQLGQIPLLAACFNPLTQQYALKQASTVFVSPPGDDEVLCTAYFFALLAGGANFTDVSSYLEQCARSFPNNSAWTLWACLLDSEENYSSFVNLNRKLKTNQLLFRWNERTLNRATQAFLRSSYHPLIPEMARATTQYPGFAFDITSMSEKSQGQLVSIAAQSLCEAALQMLRTGNGTQAWLLIRICDDLLQTYSDNCLFLPSQIGASQLRVSLLQRIRSNTSSLDKSVLPMFEYLLLDATEKNEHLAYMAQVLRREPCLLRLVPSAQSALDNALDSGQFALLLRRLPALANLAGNHND